MHSGSLAFSIGYFNKDLCREVDFALVLSNGVMEGSGSLIVAAERNLSHTGMILSALAAAGYNRSCVKCCINIDSTESLGNRIGGTSCNELAVVGNRSLLLVGERRICSLCSGDSRVAVSNGVSHNICSGYICLDAVGLTRERIGCEISAGVSMLGAAVCKTHAEDVCGNASRVEPKELLVSIPSAVILKLKNLFVVNEDSNSTFDNFDRELVYDTGNKLLILLLNCGVNVVNTSAVSDNPALLVEAITDKAVH